MHRGHFNTCSMMRFVFYKIENIAEKEENPGCQHFLLHIVYKRLQDVSFALFSRLLKQALVR